MWFWIFYILVTVAIGAYGFINRSTIANVIAAILGTIGVYMAATQLGVPAHWVLGGLAIVGLALLGGVFQQPWLLIVSTLLGGLFVLSASWSLLSGQWYSITSFVLAFWPWFVAVAAIALLVIGWHMPSPGLWKLAFVLLGSTAGLWLAYHNMNIDDGTRHAVIWCCLLFAGLAALPVMPATLRSATLLLAGPAVGSFVIQMFGQHLNSGLGWLLFLGFLWFLAWFVPWFIQGGRPAKTT